MSSSFGTLFRVTTFGESHGQGVGALVDGCPPGIALSETDIQPQLDRRRPAQSKLTTSREEADRVAILSGIDNGLTLGTPIALMVKNTDQRPGDYRQMRS
ncbi:MAG: chorismate synthase, partial [Desulfobacterales bacterium]